MRALTHCGKCGAERTRTKHGTRCYSCEARARDGCDNQDREGTRRLSTGPLLPWLLEQIERHGGKAAAAEALSVTDRRLTAWLSGEAKSVQLDVADRMVCAAGDHRLLYGFWPELVPEEGA